MQTKETTEKASAARIAHTPGPWEVSSSVIVVSRPADNLKIICHTANFEAIQEHAPTFIESTANARLIAAAPDLLEALKSLVPALHGRGFSPTEIEISNVINAIAKAEGRQP